MNFSSLIQSIDNARVIDKYELSGEFFNTILLNLSEREREKIYKYWQYADSQMGAEDDNLKLRNFSALLWQDAELGRESFSIQMSKEFGEHWHNLRTMFDDLNRDRLVVTEAQRNAIKIGTNDFCMYIPIDLTDSNTNQAKIAVVLNPKMGKYHQNILKKCIDNKYFFSIKNNNSGIFRSDLDECKDLEFELPKGEYYVYVYKNLSFITRVNE